MEPRKHYALSSYIFSYMNHAGNQDHIKIEINYMDRCHILPLELRQVKSRGVTERFDVLTLNKTELYASKINALLSRSAARDLYDVYYMIEKDPVLDIDLLRKCLVFYNMVGGEQDIDDIKLDNIKAITYQKIKRELKPVISKTDKFKLEEAKQVVVEYLVKLIDLTDEEKQFINEFKQKNYQPELLFDEKVSLPLRNHPMAIYRCKKE